MRHAINRAIFSIVFLICGLASASAQVLDTQTVRRDAIADLTALDTARFFVSGDTVIVEDPNRGGLFRWNPGDLSTEVGLETANYHCVWYPHDADGTGATGAWERVSYLNGEPFKPEHCGAIRGDAISDHVPFNALLELIDGLEAAPFTTASAWPIQLAGGGAYYFSSSILVPNDAHGVGFWGPDDKGATLTTDQAIPIFMVNSDLSGGGDKAGIDGVWNTSFVNLNLICTDTTLNCVGMQMNYPPRSLIRDVKFTDFWIAVDGYRYAFSVLENSYFQLVNRTAANPAEAHIRLNGVHYSDISNTPGGALYFNHNEMRGNVSDHDALEHLHLIHAIDGLWITGGHAQFYKIGTGVKPDGSLENNTITDIVVDQFYYDDPADGAVQLYLGGTIDGAVDQAKYQRIYHSNTLFRCAGSGSNGLKVEVTGLNGFDKLQDIGVTNGSQFAQCLSTAVVVNGEDAGYVEPSRFRIADSLFDRNNFADGVANSSFQIEAKSFIFNGNQIGADIFESTRVGTFNASNGGTAQISGNDFTGMTIEEVGRPINITESDVGGQSQGQNLKPGIGRSVLDNYNASTEDGAAVLFFTDMLNDATLATIYVQLAAHTTDDSDKRWGGFFRVIASRSYGPTASTPDGTLTEHVDAVVHSSETVDNPCPVSWTFLGGDAYSSGMTVSNCQMITNAGNVYMVIDEGDGTLVDATGPDSTAGRETVDDVILVYIAPVRVSRLALIVVGDAGDPMNWVANVNMVKSQ